MHPRSDSTRAVPKSVVAHRLALAPLANDDTAHNIVLVGIAPGVENTLESYLGTYQVRITRLKTKTSKT